MAPDTYPAVKSPGMFTDPAESMRIRSVRVVLSLVDNVKVPPALPVLELTISIAAFVLAPGVVPKSMDAFAFNTLSDVKIR